MTGQRNSLDGLHITTKKTAFPFPLATLGYFYAYLDSRYPICGQVRFRVMPDKATSAFDAGHDLLAPSGHPWHVSFARLLNTPAASGLMSVLVRDDLIREEDASYWLRTEHLHIHGNGRIVGLGRPFDVELNVKALVTFLGYGREAIRIPAQFKAELRTRFELHESYRTSADSYQYLSDLFHRRMGSCLRRRAATREGSCIASVARFQVHINGEFRARYVRVSSQQGRSPMYSASCGVPKIPRGEEESCSKTTSEQIRAIIALVRHFSNAFADT
jgi:hypothetical protein